jgi:hypothetical protein
MITAEAGAIAEQADAAGTLAKEIEGREIPCYL